MIDGIFAASERACMNFCRDHSPSSAKMHESDNQVLSEVWMVYGASSVTRPNIPVLARSTWMNFVLCMEVLVLNNVSVAM